jgi:hypothetical protein
MGRDWKRAQASTRRNRASPSPDNLIRALVWNCGNQSFRCQGKSSSSTSCEAKSPKRNTGTDRPVRARKTGNAVRAKGTGQAVAFRIQLVTGLTFRTSTVQCDANFWSRGRPVSLARNAEQGQDLALQVGEFGFEGLHRTAILEQSVLRDEAVEA